MRTLRHLAPALVALALAWGPTFPAPAAAQRLPRVMPADAGMSATRLDRLTDALETYVRDRRLPGASVMVLRDGAVVYEATVGMADREAGTPVVPGTLYRIASQTKAVVSVAVMMLQEEGRLLIGDPVSDYLPGFATTTVAEPREGGGYDVRPARRPITIRDLLTHTAGIDYGYGPASDRWNAAGVQGWYFADRNQPIRTTVERMAALPMAAHPAEAWVYGYATDVLGAVVEVVSGLTLDAFLRSQILDPLGMRDTRFYLPPEQAGRLAAVYNGSADGPVRRAPDGAGMQTQGQYVIGQGPATSFSGGAGLVSTAEDYARFLQMLLNGGELDGVRLLSPTTVDLMTRNHVGDLFGGGAEGGLGFGLGFRVVLDRGATGRPPSDGTFSWGGAYHSTYWVDPAEGLVVVYFTQVVPAPGLDDHARLEALVYQAVVESRSGVGAR